MPYIMQYKGLIQSALAVEYESDSCSLGFFQ